MKITLVIVLIWACFNTPALAQAPEREVKDFSVKEMISYFAEYYKADEKELSKVAKCESSFNQKAVGDGGRAYGIFQYHKPTFDRFSKLLGEDLDYYSAHDQLKLTAFVFAEYPQYKKHWSCYTKHFAVK